MWVEHYEKMRVLKLNRFWSTYFIIRILYLFFAVLVFPKLTTFGDPIHYMTSGIPFPISSSTDIMCFIGGILGTILGGFNIISNLPFMLMSFYLIKWAVETLDIRKYIHDKILLLLISLPSFCIWTSVCSKECVGLFFSVILGMLILRYMEGLFKIGMKEFLAIIVALFFKPQYMPFIISTLLYLRLTNGVSSQKKLALISVLYIFTLIWAIYIFRDLIDLYSFGVQKAFEFDSLYSNSTRALPFFEDKYDYFFKAPWGMITAFWGPTFNEALHKPFHAFVYIESFILFILLLYLAKDMIKRLFLKGLVSIRILTSYWVLFTGILLVHYPFGIFNPGSATRYRNNFLFLFIILLMYLFSFYKKRLEQKVIR